jgi:hypothetical protein
MRCSLSVARRHGVSCSTRDLEGITASDYSYAHPRGLHCPTERCRNRGARVSGVRTRSVRVRQAVPVARVPGAPGSARERPPRVGFRGLTLVKDPSPPAGHQPGLFTKGWGGSPGHAPIDPRHQRPSTRHPERSEGSLGEAAARRADPTPGHATTSPRNQRPPIHPSPRAQRGVPRRSRCPQGRPDPRPRHHDPGSSTKGGSVSWQPATTLHRDGSTPGAAGPHGGIPALSRRS